MRTIKKLSMIHELLSVYEADRLLEELTDLATDNQVERLYRIMTRESEQDFYGSKRHED